MADKTREDIKAENMTDFDQLGEDHVRLKIDKAQWSGSRLTWAIEWLAKKDQESRRRNEASSSASLRIAKSAKNAAWAAVTMAAVAAIIAAVSMVIAYVAFRASGK